VRGGGDDLASLATSLRRAGAGVVAAAAKATQAQGEIVAQQARGSAPRDRPWLANSGIRVSSGSASDAAWSYVFTTTDPEGRPSGFFVEYGTSVMPPQPFLTPAAATASASFPAALTAALEALLR